jgi:hypothetical protein
MTISDDDFPASERTPGQAASRAARLNLDNWLKEQQKRPAWFELWEDMRSEMAPVVGADGEPALNERGQVRTRRRWDWRKALYIAWASLPKHLREPKTLEELVSLLGLGSSGTIRNWRRNDPEIVERIAAVPKELLLDHVSDVLAALTAVAADPDPKAHQDRKLFLELTKVYNPKGIIELEGSIGLDDPLEDADQAAVEELLRARARERSGDGSSRTGAPASGAA